MTGQLLRIQILWLLLFMVTIAYALGQGTSGGFEGAGLGARSAVDSEGETETYVVGTALNAEAELPSAQEQSDYYSVLGYLLIADFALNVLLLSAEETGTYYPLTIVIPFLDEVNLGVGRSSREFEYLEDNYDSVTARFFYVNYGYHFRVIDTLNLATTIGRRVAYFEFNRVAPEPGESSKRDSNVEFSKWTLQVGPRWLPHEDLLVAADWEVLSSEVERRTDLDSPADLSAVEQFEPFGTGTVSLSVSFFWGG